MRKFNESDSQKVSHRFPGWETRWTEPSFVSEGDGRERKDQREIIEFSYLIAQVFSQHPRSVLNEVFRDEFIWKVHVFHKKSPWRICSLTIPFIRVIALASATLAWLYTGWKFWDSLKEQCRLKTLFVIPDFILMQRIDALISVEKAEASHQAVDPCLNPFSSASVCKGCHIKVPQTGWAPQW